MRTLIFFLLCMSCCGCGFSRKERPANPTDRTVEIFGEQFRWRIRYAGADNRLGYANYRFISAANPVGVDTNDVQGFDDLVSDDTLFLPVDEPVNLHVRSRDVIHSVYLPQFRMQFNVPGMTTIAHLTAMQTTTEMRDSTKLATMDFMLLCNKLCGAEHYRMSAKVIVGTRDEFEAWLKRQKKYLQK